MVISLSPSTLEELRDETPEIADSCFSIGVATVDAMVAALAPSRLAVITIVGKSTFGSALIGNCRYPTKPKIKKADISSVVMTGRRMHSSGKFIGRSPPQLSAIDSIPGAVREGQIARRGLNCLKTPRFWAPGLGFARSPYA